MTGSYTPVGVPVSIGGQWLQPTHIWDLTASPYPGNPTSALTLPAYAPADLLPISLATSELTALVSAGRATMSG